MNQRGGAIARTPQCRTITRYSWGHMKNMLFTPGGGGVLNMFGIINYETTRILSIHRRSLEPRVQGYVNGVEVWGAH